MQIVDLYTYITSPGSNITHTSSGYITLLYRIKGIDFISFRSKIMKIAKSVGNIYMVICSHCQSRKSHGFLFNCRINRSGKKFEIKKSMFIQHIKIIKGSDHP